MAEPDPPPEPEPALDTVDLGASVTADAPAADANAEDEWGFSTKKSKKKGKGKVCWFFFSLCVVTRLKLRGGIWSSGDERGAIFDLGAFPDEPATRQWHWKIPLGQSCRTWGVAQSVRSYRTTLPMR